MKEKTRMIIYVSFIAAIMILSLILQPDWGMIKTEIAILIIGGLMFILGKMLGIWK